MYLAKYMVVLRSPSENYQLGLYVFSCFLGSHVGPQRLSLFSRGPCAPPPAARGAQGLTAEKKKDIAANREAALLRKRQIDEAQAAAAQNAVKKTA